MKFTLPAVLTTLTGMAIAQGASPVTQKTSPLVMTVSQALVKSVTQNGKTTEQRIDKFKSVVPGDVVAYTLTVRNVSDNDLNNVAPILLVPASTTYLAPDGEVGSLVKTEYSIDGGKTFAARPTKKVTVTENGKSVTREVEAKRSEYQKVRWTIPKLRAGTELKLGFRVQVK